MASNNPSAYSPSYRRGPTSPPAPGKVQAPGYESDGLSDDDTLLALSSVARMETNRAPRQNLQQEKTNSHSSDCIDVVQQAIDAVEGALARCPKYERREALTELLMHAKLEQAKKASVYNSDCLQHANVWVAMLMQVQELGRNYPKDPQVHQLVYLVQQCVAKGGKHEVPESDGHHDSLQRDDQQETSENVKQDEVPHQDLGEEMNLCGRMGEAAVDVGLDADACNEDDDIGYRITNEIADAMSNQAEDASEVEPSKQDDIRESKHVDDPEFNEVNESAKVEEKNELPSPVSRPRVLLPILTGNTTVKGVQVPRLPRGSDSDSDKATPISITTKRSPTKSVGKSSRMKFQFPEKELLQLLEDEETNPGAELSPGLINSYRRFSTNSKITCAVPLRRKSFSMKRSPLRGPVFPGFAQIPVIASASRRNSRSFSVTKHQILAFNNIKLTAASPRKTSSGSPRPSSSASPPSPVPSTQTQMVLRVRERASDGVPELVIAKKPVRVVMWHWNDRRVRVPFMSAANFMELGPAQHGIMLRQLRYVKSMMHELPWAKAHLRSLLSRYTAKEVTKEELYPQLNALGQQVQREINSRAKQHRALTARKQRLTVTLTLATSVVNDTLVTKFGRRGRPHASRLLYDPTSPLQLRWRRKHGERSVEYLTADEIEVIEVPDGAGSFGRGNKKAAAAVAVDPESCLSLVTPSRSLDLQVASALHREWLANAVRDIVSFAQQYKAAKASTASVSDGSSSGESIPSNTANSRRPRPLPSSRNVVLY
ncbi:hypothetical protein PHMEG_0009418 [Phytophthora megakarya]|uniref:Uncharacterized protein n=1 Tax=Phytophthora megakarya TaxID=4795 RepID=A0A225WG88_9STRA|nr:hypothetical protein PHMEG_0009418 [Phytophthora megakarya]